MAENNIGKITDDIDNNMLTQLIDKMSDNKLKEVIKSITMMSEKFDEMRNEMHNLKRENIEIKKDNANLKKENESLKKEIKNISIRLSDIEINHIEKELEIVGIPEEKDENLSSIMENIFKNINIGKSEIKMSQITRSKYGKRGQRNIIITMDNKNQKEMILKKGKQHKRELTLDKVKETNQKTPFYINESLPKAKKDLLKQVKTLKNELGIKYVWVSNGEILTRKSDKDKSKLIKSIEDLDKI